MTDLDRGVAVFDRPAPVTADITPRDWHINPRTGWPWPGVIGRPGDSPELVETRRRAATRIRVVRQLIRTERPYVTNGLYGVLPRERISCMRAEIAALRAIFRPAPRAGRSDLAGLPGGMPASRDGSAQPEAPDRAASVRVGREPRTSPADVSLSVGRALHSAPAP